MTVATLLSWGAWGLVLMNMDPAQAGLAGFILFYITLLMSLIGTLTLAGVLYRVLLVRNANIITRQVRVAFRHAVLLSLVAILTLILAGNGILKWWIMPVVIMLVCGIEYFFLISEESRRT